MRAEESKKVLEVFLGHARGSINGRLVVGSQFESKGSPVATSDSGRLTPPCIVPGAETDPGHVVR